MIYYLVINLSASNIMASSIRHDRSEPTRDRTDVRIRVAQSLCLAAVLTALAASALVGLLTLWAPVEAAPRLAVLFGAGVFGSCSISSLLGAVVVSTA